MMYDIVYHDTVVREDIPKLDKGIREQIRIAIEKKLTNAPEIFGKPLRQSLKGYRKLRVGDYRIIFRIGSKKVKVLIISHRSNVYTRTQHRQ